MRVGTHEVPDDGRSLKPSSPFHLHAHHQVAKWTVNVFASALHGWVVGRVHGVDNEILATLVCSCIQGIHFNVPWAELSRWWCNWHWDLSWSVARAATTGLACRIPRRGLSASWGVAKCKMTVHWQLKVDSGIFTFGYTKPDA